MTAKDKRIIEKARMLMDRDAPEQNERIRQELESLYRCQSTYADEALAILSQYEMRQRRNDPDQEQLVRELKAEGLALNGPDDGRLPAFIHRLGQQPATVIGKLAQLQTHFCDWLTAEMGKMGESTDRVRHNLDQLTQSLERVSGLSHELEEGLAAYRLHRETLHFEQVKKDIAAALEEWDLPKAWRHFDTLESASEGFWDRVRALRDEILAVGHLNERAKELLMRQVPDPLTWINCPLALAHLLEVETFLGDNKLAPSKKESLQLHGEGLRKAIVNFLKAQAKLATDQDGLIQFQENYQSVFGGESQALFEQSASWFAKGRESLIADFKAKVEASLDPAHLQSVLSDAFLVSRKLPPTVAVGFDQLVADLQKIQNIWTRLLRGEDLSAALLEITEKEPLKPKALVADIANNSRWITSIRACKQVLLEDSKNPEALETAFRLSGEILSQHDNHLGALELKRLAGQTASRNEMDQALRQLNISRFVELASAENQDHPYQRLSEKSQVLHDLKKAAHDPVDFSDLEQVKAWTDLWQSALQELPEDMPQALRMKLTAIRIDRKIEWHQALEALDQATGSIVSWRFWLEALVPFEREFDLADFIQRIQHWERLAIVQYHLEQEDWEQAKLALAELSFDDPEYVRLRGEIKLSQAKSQGIYPLSKELLESWSTLTKAFSPDQMVDVLEEALFQAWDLNERSALNNLRAALDRVVQEALVPDGRLKILEVWRDCLLLEPQLLQGKPGQVQLQSFYTLYQSAKKHDFFKQWMRRLLASWQKNPERLVLYAWGKRAFGRASFLEDLWEGLEHPEKVLQEQSETAAEEAIAFLKTEQTQGSEALIHVEQQLEGYVQIWEEFRHYLAALPKKTTYLSPPEPLKQALNHVRVIKECSAKLDHLEQADLRLNETNLKLDMMYSQLGELGQNQFTIAASLRDRVAQLQNLFEATFLHAQLMKVARRCGEMEQVDEPGLFLELVRQLQGLYDHFKEYQGTHLGFWEILSRECLAEIPNSAGILLDVPGSLDFHGLITSIKQLQENENYFRQRVEQLQEMEPPGNDIDPAIRGDYLELFPKNPPASKRAFYLFHRYAQRKDASNKIQQGRDYLGEWIRNYLDGGLPWSS